MKRKIKTLLGQTGFSLLEMMIVAGMAGAMSMVVVKLMENSTRAVKNAEIRNDYIVVQNRVGANMSDEISCYETLKGITIGAGSETDLTEVIRCKESEEVNHPLSASDPLFANVKVRRCKASGREVLYNNINEYGENNYTLEFKFAISSLSAAGAGGTGTGIGELEMIFKRTNKGKTLSDGTYDISRKIEVIFEHDGGSLIKCYNNESNMINTAVARACTGPNARLIGDVNNSANPLRCVHDVDTTTECAPNEYFNGYMVGPHPTTAGAATLIPRCTPITEKTTGCGPSQYVVEKDDGAGHSLSCHTIPSCGPGEHLARGADGLLACVTMQFTCAEHQMIVINAAGNPSCIGCAAGEALIRTPSGWQCKSMVCNDSKTNGQEYFVGFDSNGDAMCRTLIKAQQPCQFGGQLEIQGDGSIGMTCCPDCSAAQKAGYCTGTSFVAPNSCGSICLGSKPIKNATPGNWYISNSCSSFNYVQIERRNCQSNAECGGDASCEGLEMERRTDCEMYQQIHTFAQCASSGGVPAKYNGNWFCRFNGTSCPGGWTRYNQLGSTLGFTGCGASRSCAVDKCSKTCDSAGHYWQDKGIESCTVKVKCCLGSNSNTCHNTLYQVGCY